MLHLIGTLPRELDGPERRGALLASLRPTAIAVEGSQAAADRARTTRDPVLDDALEGVLSTPGHAAATANLLFRIASPAHAYFHIAAATRYATRRRIPLVFLGPVHDLPALPSLTVPSPPPVTTQALLTLFGSRDWFAASAETFARTRSLLDESLPVDRTPAAPAAPTASSATVDWIEAATHAIRQLLENPADAVVAVVCPATQLRLTTAEPTLYRRLRDQTTARHLLDGNGPISPACDPAPSGRYVTNLHLALTAHTPVFHPRGP